jgi:SNF2 family DNA or RNA helicase
MGAGGILGDEMGLGKTLQARARRAGARWRGGPGRRDGWSRGGRAAPRAGPEASRSRARQVVAFLAFLKAARGEPGPHLVVAPLSVINAWANEAAKWAPSLRLVTFHGTAHERERIRHQVSVCPGGWARGRAAVASCA